MAKLSSFLKYLSDIDLYRNKIFNVQKIIGPSIYEANSALGNSLEVSTNDEKASTGHLVLRTGVTAEGESGSIYLFAGKDSEFRDGKFNPGDQTKPYEGITIHPNTDISIISSSSKIELQAKEGVFISKGNRGSRNTIDTTKDSYIGLYNSDSNEYVKIYSKNNVEINPKTLLREYGNSLIQIFNESTEQFGTLNIYAGASTGENATSVEAGKYALEADSTTSTEKVGNVNIYESLNFTGKTIVLTPEESFTLTCSKEDPKLKIEGDKETSSIEVVDEVITNSLSIANILNLKNKNFKINAEKNINFNLNDSFSLIGITGSNNKTIIESFLDEDEKRTTTLNVDYANISTKLISDKGTSLQGTTLISDTESGTLDIKGTETTITSDTIKVNGATDYETKTLTGYLGTQKNYVENLTQQINSSTRKIGILESEDTDSLVNESSNVEFEEVVNREGYTGTSETSYTLNTNKYILGASGDLEISGLSDFKIVANRSASSETIQNLTLKNSFTLEKGTFTLADEVDSFNIKAENVSFSDSNQFILDAPTIEIGNSVSDALKNSRLHVESLNDFKLEVDNSRDVSTVKIKEAKIDSYLSVYDTLKLGVNSEEKSNEKEFKLISPVKLTQTAYEFEVTHCDASGKKIDNSKCSPILTSRYSGNENERESTLNVENATINTSLTSSKGTTLNNNTSIDGELTVTGSLMDVNSAEINIGEKASTLNIKGDALTEGLSSSTRTIGTNAFVEEINTSNNPSLAKITAPNYILESSNSLNIYGGGNSNNSTFYIEANTNESDLKAKYLKASDKVQAKNSVEIGSINSTSGMTIYWDASSKSMIFAAIGA